MSGKIVCTLNEVWKGSQKELSQKSGVNKNTLTAWFHNKIKRMDLDTLARICAAASVTPGDILVFIPEQDKKDRALQTILSVKDFFKRSTLRKILIDGFELSAEDADKLLSEYF